MSKEPAINMNDPLFLASRELDGDLTIQEQARLSEFLVASPELQAEVEQIKAVARLVERRASARAQVDWNSHEKLILAHIANGTGELSGVDQLLENWASRAPQYDERRFAQAVASRIKPAQGKTRSAWRIVARLGAPLAAAAAVALVVTSSWYPPTKELARIPVAPVTVVEIGPRGEADPGGTIVVSFARPPEDAPGIPSASSIGFMALGSSPITQTVEESPL